MGQKVKNGGTVSQARLGYLNVRIPKPGGGEIRTIAVDDERAPFVGLAFELYATNDYTLADLSDELYDRGLRTRATARRPAGPISINKLSLMLRDRYYLGYVTYQGQEYPGRHEPLIDQELFDRVQAIADTRSAAQERRRIHHHYLKGSLFCGRCEQAGRTGRLIIQRAINRHGTTYMYFFCRNKQVRTCSTPHINMLHVEDAVEEYYATIRFTSEFITEVRAHVAVTMADTEVASRLRRQQLRAELRALDVREDNLINLMATTDETVPTAKAKIVAKLREIEHQRQHLTKRLGETDDDLADSAHLIELCLRLLEHPQELYRRCDDEQRRLLNQALFEAIYIDHDEVTDAKLREPFAQLHTVQRQMVRVNTTTAETAVTRHHKNTRAIPHDGDGPCVSSGIESLISGIGRVQGSSKPSMVELRGIEPLTPSMRTRCATNCATAPGRCCVSITGATRPPPGGRAASPARRVPRRPGPRRRRRRALRRPG